uniref:Sec1 family domain-containing protein 1 n=1 Tax=Strix occidentalis caurina TaxID=311401 RepID=A0A8D0FEG1_STROC
MLVVLLLHSDRDAIPDVPAVYFVMPTEENIDRMCQVNSVFNVSDERIQQR